MIIRLLVVLGVLAVSGCGNPQDNLTETVSGPFVLGFPGAYKVCKQDPAVNISPEAWERSEFISRIHNNRVEMAINIPCLLNAFPHDVLMEYRNMNDPVARLALVFHTYDGRGDLACSEIDHIRSELYMSYSSLNDKVPGPKSRVPEAAFVMSLVQAYCEPGSDEFNRLNLVSYELGYDVAAARVSLLE